MITLTYVYWLAGATFAAFALLGLRDRANPKRFGNGAFWGLLAVSMLAGDYLGDFGNGLLVLGLVGIAGLGGLGALPAARDDSAERQARAARYGNGLFGIALIIPATALAGTVLFGQYPALVETKNVINTD